MSICVFRLTLDAMRGAPPVGTVEVASGDRGQTIEFSVVRASEPFDMTGLDVELRARCPGGYVRSPCAVSGSTATYTVGGDITSRAGDFEACLVLMQGDSVVCSTQPFRFRVSRSADLSGEEQRDVGLGFDRLMREWEEQTERQQAEFEESEGARRSAESAREDAEEGRLTAEEGRVAAESSRADAEGKRASAESGRADAEGARSSAESARASAEASRSSAEEGRASAEGARASAESARAEAERARELAQARNDADQGLNNQSALSAQPVFLAPGQFDPGTLAPTVPDPVPGRLYLVPMSADRAGEMLARSPLSGMTVEGFDAVAEAAASGNAYVEWLWHREASSWEQLGVSNKLVTPVSTSDIDSVVGGGSPQGEEVLNLTGLSYLWARLEALVATDSDIDGVVL